ncbi:MAG: phosphoribosylamine--glycine ligase [Candidatus Taylorbacteria bacterium]|nr:phosphoribosylamine--glycine ligase [Candidatus Taylorbacteria bacterium]
MRILIIGGGGREHSIGWKLKQSKKVKKIYFSPGNGGTSLIGKNIQIDNSNHQKVGSWAKKNKINLVVIGPDQYLAEGLADSLQKKNIKVFGPTKIASEIEWSKSFAKQFMIEEGIPTAKFAIFNNFEKANSYIKKQKFPLVIKADGLASGKGVVIAKSFLEAESALKEMMKKKIYGNAGSRVVIEEYLTGKEISIHAFSDGKTTKLFPSSQDHKRIFDSDSGPNTGGMGTISPLPWVTKKLMLEIHKKIVKPTIKGLEKRNRKFVGVLYPGIMVTKQGPKVIEFNARFGDPETQVYMRLLENDLLDILFSCIEGRLSKTKIKWKKESASCVVLASGGYPGKYKNGLSIKWISDIKGTSVFVFHAGTKKVKNKFVTNGGRVINVTSTGRTLKNSLNKTYKAVNTIDFKGMQFRKDIGVKSL